jgi:hypothetical protein
LEGSDVDGRTILRLICRKFKLDGGKDWIDMTEERDRWWALVTRKFTFGFRKMQRIS